MNVKGLIFTLLLTLTNLIVGAEDFSSLHIDSDNGLTQCNVKSITQDKYGFIWLGTKNGLNRYDGHQLVQIKVWDKKAGCGNQNISALFCDKSGTLWVGTDEGLYAYDTADCTFTRLLSKAQDHTSIKGWISNIAEDKRGRLWITVGDQGLFCYQQGQLKHYLHNYAKHEMPCYVIACTDGSIWACSWNSGIFHYDENRDTFLNIRYDANGRSLYGLQMNTLAQMNNKLIISIQNGRLMEYDMRQNTLDFIDRVDLKSTIVRNAAVYGHEIWIGTHNGLYIYDTKTEKVTHIQHNHMQMPRSLLSDNIIYCTYCDQEGGVWLGTMFGGADCLRQESKAFKHLYKDDFGNMLSGYRIRDIIEHNGGIYVGTEDNGISRIDMTTGRITNHSCPFIPLSFFTIKGNLGTSLFKKGLLWPEGHNDNNLYRLLSNAGMESTGSIYSAVEDNAGNIWFGTDNGVIMVNLTTQKAENIQKMRNNWIYDIAIDRSGNIWFASMGHGVWKREAKSSRYIHYTHNDKDATSLSSNSVSGITIDHTGTPWFSTDRGGICRYNQKANNFSRYSKEEGLPDDIAYKIVEDNDGYLWFGTNRGLVRLNPVDNTIKTFTTRDGLPTNQFNYCGAILATDGNIYMATLNGLLTFAPRFTSQGTINDIFFTDVKIDGKSVTPGEKNSPLKENILLANHITLHHDQTHITFNLSTMQYSSVRGSNYEYRLYPIDNEWHSTGNSSEISYASLAPGTYKLQIRVLSSADKREYIEKELTIEVLPVWWRSNTAYAIYTLVIIVLTLLTFKRAQVKQRRKFEEQQKLYKIEKEKELYKNKVEFFTEVAHEIRTPLTLINGPLEIINETTIDDPRLKKNLNVIGQNTRRLLSLASQLLDFRKVGTDHLKPKFEMVNVTELLTYTIERFEPTFTHNGKTLKVAHIEEKVTANIDREAITKVLSNLLNNALKYSTSTTTITLEANTEKLKLTVLSDGQKITGEDAEHIFEPFFRLSNTGGKGQMGSGIGLTLARSLAQLHKGQLYLDPNNATGNAFVLTLPLDTQSTPAEKEQIAKELTAAPNHPLEDKPTLTNENSKGRTVLVVEDEEEIRELMADRLQSSFIVETAANGIEALEILRKEHVDIVVSDIMMPQMDGIELCHNIKGNIKFSHIPVVFLTAKNDTDSKIEGLKAGAEAYVEKPFSFEYLLSQINSLLNNREKERQTFSKRPFFKIDNIQMSKEDEEMMQKVMTIINENIHDEDFNVEKLADLMFMSRSSLLRKIKQLFNMPPLEFIRLIRLKKAAELIQEGSHRIGEICYLVGFGNPSYFAKMFNRQFGVTPKEFEQQMNKLRKQNAENPSDNQTDK